ncbi:MAG: Minf_1886 family protein [Gemmataceae bacterium]
MDARILDLCREVPHYAYEAYEFVCEAVTFTQDRLGRKESDEEDEPADHHVSGEELLHGVCDLAINNFGKMAPIVFKLWNVKTTDDIGRMVFNLIRVGRLSKSDRDCLEDFQDLFDLPLALCEGFELTIDHRPSVKRSER